MRNLLLLLMKVEHVMLMMSNADRHVCVGDICVVVCTFVMICG